MLDRDTVLLCIGEQFFTRGQVPLAPRRDHLDVGLQRVGAELEAHLVVALAGGAVGDGVGTRLLGDLDQPLGDQRPRNRRAQQVFAFIDGVGPEHRKHEVAHELLAQRLDIDLLDAHGLGLGARRFDLLALPDIGGERDHLATVGFLQPLEDDRGVQAA